MSSATKQVASVPHKRMKRDVSESTTPSTNFSGGAEHANPNSSATIQPNDSSCQSALLQKTGHCQSGTAIAFHAPNSMSKSTLQASHPLASSGAKPTFKLKSSSKAHSQLVSQSQDDSFSNHSCTSDSDSERERGQSRESTREKVARCSCMLPEGDSFYQRGMQRCKSTCCEYISFKQTAGFEFLTNSNDPESRNICRGTASDILELALFNEQKLEMQKKFRYPRVSNEGLNKTGRKRRILLDEKFSISITPRDVITQDTKHVCLKTLIGNIAPDTSKIFKIISRGSEPRANDYSLFSTFGPQLKKLINPSPSQVNTIHYPCPKLLKIGTVLHKPDHTQAHKGDAQLSFQHFPTFPSSSKTKDNVHFNQNSHLMKPSTSSRNDQSATSPSKTNYKPKQKPEPTSIETERSNSETQVPTCPPTSVEKNPASKDTGREASINGKSSSSESLQKPGSEESDIPYLTVKDPSQVLIGANHAGTIKLFIGDLCILRSSPREKHFFYFDSIVHRINIFGTITSIRKCTPNKYVYDIEDGSGIVSCAHILSESEAKGTKCNQFLHQIQDSMMNNSADSNMSQLSVDEEYESALSGLEVVAKSYLEQNLGKCPFRLGSTVSAIGVLVKYQNKRDLKLYEIRTMRINEMEDWMQEMIVLYKQIYPKTIQGFPTT